MSLSVRWGGPFALLQRKLGVGRVYTGLYSDGLFFYSIALQVLNFLTPFPCAAFWLDLAHSRLDYLRCRSLFPKCIVTISLRFPHDEPHSVIYL